MTARIGLILLAAGGSRRLGQPKQLLAFEGRTLLRRAAEAACGSICRPDVVVLGAEYERCTEELVDRIKRKKVNVEINRTLVASSARNINKRKPSSPNLVEFTLRSDSQAR